MTNMIDWLLEGPAWIKYRTRVDLLEQPESAPEVIEARRDVLSDPAVQTILAELAQWPGAVLNSHKSAGHPMHKFNFVADLGLRIGDPGIDNIVTKVMEHQSATGPFQIVMNIPPHFGGTGEDQWAWALCDAPNLVYALCKFGLAEDGRVQRAIEHLVSLIRENGWPCAVSPEMGKFRGPGRKDDPCPYANLAMLKMLAQAPQWKDSSFCHIGAEALLFQWSQRQNNHPFMFYMGTDFCKLKAPLVWFDILHLMDVLSQFDWLCEDARLGEMAEMVRGKADQDGFFTPESVWQAWKEWEFGQKKLPSRWLTLIVQRALRRIDRVKSA